MRVETQLETLCKSSLILNVPSKQEESPLSKSDRQKFKNFNIKHLLSVEKNMNEDLDLSPQHPSTGAHSKVGFTRSKVYEVHESSPSPVYLIAKGQS